MLAGLCNTQKKKHQHTCWFFRENTTKPSQNPTLGFVGDTMSVSKELSRPAMLCPPQSRKCTASSARQPQRGREVEVCIAATTATSFRKVSHRDLVRMKQGKLCLVNTCNQGEAAGGKMAGKAGSLKLITKKHPCLLLLSPTIY